MVTSFVVAGVTVRRMPCGEEGEQPCGLPKLSTGSRRPEREQLLVADVPRGVAGSPARSGDARGADEADDAASVAGEGLEDLEHGVVAVDGLAGEGEGHG